MGDPSNPFLEPSPLPYRLPLFALVRPEHYREAIEAGMREQRAEDGARGSGEGGSQEGRNAVEAGEEAPGSKSLPASALAASWVAGNSLSISFSAQSSAAPS